MDNAALYLPTDIWCKLVVRPAIFAFPMLVRSRKDKRYSRQS